MKIQPGTRRLRQQGIAGIGTLSLLAVAALSLALLIAYQFVDPAPPKHIVLATGADGGAYQRFGQEYVALLAEHGVDVSLRPSAGSAQNLEWLQDESGVDVAFVQSGLAPAEADAAVMALGSLYLEPLLLFVRDDIAFQQPQDLSGMRVAIGEEGSGTRAVALRLLAAHGLDASKVELPAVPPGDLATELESARIDAAFVVGDPASDVVDGLVHSGGARLVSLDRAAAYARQYSYLTPITLPAGVLDLEEDIPTEDVQTVATTATLIARSDLHPALVDLLLIAATEIHSGHSLLASRDTFPSPQFVDLPLSDEAERHFRRGPPFLMRYLPFWAATLVDRLWVMLFPLLGLAIPLFKLVPPAYQWQVRRRFLRLYAELERLDPSVSPLGDDGDLEKRIERIDWLEGQSAATVVPREYKDAKYKLRRDIDLVRRRLVAGMCVALLSLASFGSVNAWAQGQSDEELAKQLANPIAALVSVPIQLNYDQNIGPEDDGDRWTLNVQPVIPFELNDDWNLISRTILPLVTQSAIYPGAGSQSGTGDIVQSLFFSPKDDINGWTVGAGPVFLVPTGSDDLLTTDKWGAGPTGVALKQSGPWTYGALANHIWSFAGDSDRQDINATFLQPFVTYTTPAGMSFTFQTESTYDWEGGNWTIPVAGVMSKVLAIGSRKVSVGGGVRYYVDSPANGPDGLGVRLFFTLLFPR